MVFFHLGLMEKTRKSTKKTKIVPSKMVQKPLSPTAQPDESSCEKCWSQELTGIPSVLGTPRLTSSPAGGAFLGVSDNHRGFDPIWQQNPPFQKAFLGHPKHPSFLLLGAPERPRLRRF